MHLGYAWRYCESILIRFSGGVNDQPVNQTMFRTSISAPARTRRQTRAAITSLHRWFGLFAAFWLFGIALTGSLIAFNGELDSALNPDLFSASGKGPVAPLLADAARRVDQGKAGTGKGGAGKIDFLRYHHDVPGLVSIGLTDANGERFERLYDSGTARLNGERLTSALGLGPRDLMRTIYRLHYSFLGGRVLEIFLGLVALGWAVTQLLALMIAFTSRRRWRDSFRVRRGATAHKRNFDLHRSLGLWLYPVTLTLAVSGVYLNLPDEFTAAVSGVATVEGRFAPQPAQAPPTATPRLTMADASARFDAIAAPLAVTSFSYNDKAAQYRARMLDARDVSDNGQRIVWISAADGRVVSDKHEMYGGAGDSFIAWQFPLHSGRALGLAGRILISLTGVVICISIITGILIWWKKRRQRQRMSMRGVPSRPV